LLGLICGGDSNYGDALSKAYTFFEAAPFTNRMNRMFFLSDGKPSLTGVTEVQQGISWKNPSRASDYATQRQNLDFYEVERVAVGVCGGADLRAGFDMDIIDNTGNGPSSDISNDCKIRNPIVGSILDLEVWINGKKDQTITKDSLTENSLGYHLPETAVEGFDPTDGVVNQVEVKCRIDADGDTSTTEDMMTMSSGETVTGKLVTGVGSTTSCEVACCDGTKACNEEDCPKFTEYGSIDVCFALDESGSVCSSSSPNLCSGSGRSSVCDYNGKYDKKDPQFCPKFNTNTKDFVKGFIRELDKVAGPKSVSTRYSVITFSSNADNDQALSDSATTINTINNLQYEGGYTRTAEAMKQCQDYLQKGNPMADKLIVLVTDGRPRYDGSDPASYRVTLVPSYAANIKAGKEADNASRSAPIMKIMAIGVRTVESNLDFVEDLASPGMSFKLADGYENLSDKIALVAKEALQSSCGGIVIPR
jgi:Mg-chelatase subunit ChlD